MVVAFLQFVGLVLDENLTNGQVLTYVYKSSKVFRCNIQSTLIAIPILLFATVGLFLVLYMHHSWGTMSTVMTHSQWARHIMRATMLASWVLFLWMILHFYRTTKVASDVVREKKPVSLFQDIYTPQVTAGYAQFGSFLAILLFEAPFLIIYFFRKFTGLHNTKQQLSKTDCHLCYWITVLCDTLGGIGVVAAVQIASVYIFYIALFLTVSPIFTIAWVMNVIACITVGIVCVVMLLEMATSCCKTCSFERIFKGLAFLLLGMLCIALNYYAVKQVRGDKHNNHNSIRDLLTSLVSSVIIAIYGYIVKKLLYRKKEGVGMKEKDILESTPLTQKEQNIP